jgi:hypothetical protein
MPDEASRREVAPLKTTERLIAAAAGIALFAAAFYVLIAPPERRVALPQCPNSAAGCIVHVDYDATTFATV